MIDKPSSVAAIRRRGERRHGNGHTLLIVGGPATAPSVVGRESRGRQHDSEQMATVVGADGARPGATHRYAVKSELSDLGADAGGAVP